MRSAIFLVVILLSLGWSSGQQCPDRYTPTPDGTKCLMNNFYNISTRDEAKEICHADKGNLVSIHDAFMNNFVVSLLRQQAWIGLKCPTSNISECTWDGKDEPELTYRNFGFGMPDPSIGHCITISSDQLTAGKWFSGSCGGRMYEYMCEKDAKIIPPNTHYKIVGHYDGVTPESIIGKEKSRKDFLPEEKKIATRLSEILGQDYSEFYVQYFEIHGAAVHVPTTIYFGYLSTNGINYRDKLIELIQSPDDMQLYFLGTVDSIPPVPPVGVEYQMNFQSQIQHGNSLSSNSSCQNFGFLNEKNGTCTCPLNNLDKLCLPTTCKMPSHSSPDIDYASALFVISLRSSMLPDIEQLTASIPYLLRELDSGMFRYIESFIITTFRQTATTYFMSTEYIARDDKNQKQLINFLNGLVTGAANEEQPVISAAVAAQAFASQMRPRSMIFVLADGNPSDVTAYDVSYPPRNNETYLIAQALQWKNRIFFLLTQTESSQINTNSERFDVYRRVARALHGDVLLINKNELNHTLHNVVTNFGSNENLYVLYGKNDTFTFNPVIYDKYGGFSTFLVTVENEQRMPNVSWHGEWYMNITYKTSRFALYLADVSHIFQVTITPRGNPYNIRVFTTTGDTAWITFATDSTVDAGLSFSFAGVQQYATGYTNISPNLSGMNFQRVAFSSIEPDNKTYAAHKRLDKCEFEWGFGQIDDCTPGPYSILANVTRQTEFAYSYLYLYPSFCFTIN